MRQESRHTDLDDSSLGSGTLDLSQGDTSLKGNLPGEGAGEESGLVRSSSDLGSLLGGRSTTASVLGLVVRGLQGVGGSLGSDGGLGSLSSLLLGSLVLLFRLGRGASLLGERVGAGEVVALLSDDGDGGSNGDRLGSVVLLQRVSE
jgi:hypothetical protein